MQSGNTVYPDQLASEKLILKTGHIGSHYCKEHIYPSLVLVQPRKTHPCLTERLLMGCNESNQTKQKLL